MSHEEPDLEAPPTARLEKGLLRLGAELPSPPGVLRGRITWQTIVAGLIVAAIMGTAYPYMVLKLGFGPNVSVVAAFFGFLFLRLLDVVFRQRHYDRWQNNLTEACGTSAAQTAFMCVLLGAFDILHDKTAATGHPFGLQLPWYTSFLWLTTACTLGVLMAVPLRKHFIVDEKLPYVDGLSTAETITVLDPPRDATPDVRRAALRAFWAVMIGVAASAFIMVFREDAKFFDFIPEAWQPNPEHLVIAGAGVFAFAKMGVGVQLSLLNIGSGMLVGLRINISMMLGTTLAWVVAPYFLVKYAQVPSSPTHNQVLFWVMWPATGMLVAGGLTSLALRWRMLIDTFRQLKHATIDGSEFPLKVVVPGIAISAIALVVVQRQLLDMPIWMTLVAIVLSVPLMLVGLRVLGETNWGPISALSNMMQGVFAALAPGNIVANMVASGTAGNIATSSEMIMQDYKCGDMIGTKPRLVTIMQLIAVPVGALAVSLIYPLLVRAFHIVPAPLESVNHWLGHLADLMKLKIEIPAGLESPISQKWAGFAMLLKQGPSALSSSALWALLVFSILGVVLTVAESSPKLKRYVPSTTGIGIGILVSFLAVATMFIGGLIGYFWERTNKKSAEAYLVPLGSGFIAGEAMVAVVASIYFGLTS